MYHEEEDIEQYAIPPVGSSPVKHSPILPKKDNNQDFLRNQIKTPQVILLL